MNKTILTTLLLTVPILAGAQQPEPFKKGDRVAFVGNSITDGGHYHSYIWLYYMTRFPDRKISIYNCGIGGDTGLEILNRLDGDVFGKRPTVLTLSFGMNDSGYFEYNGDNPGEFADRKVAESKKNFLKIEQRLKEHGNTRMIMIGTSPYDQTSKFDNNIFKNKNNAMRRIIAFQDSAAKANNWPFVDFNTPMCKINERFQKTDSTFTICGNDRIHPDNDGHMVMAYLFLKAQGLDHNKVADVCITDTKKVIRTENCKVSRLKNNNGTITFDYLAKALPYPLDTVAHGWGSKRPQAYVTKVIPSFTNEMNSEKLTVHGLRGKYCLSIDGECIDTLEATQLEKGVNLAEYRHTPQYRQAMAIMALNEERLEIERRFRDYTWLQYNFFNKRGLLEANNEKAARVFREGQKSDGWVAAKQDLYNRMIHQEVRDMYNDQIDMIVNRIYKINKPVKHRIKIAPVDL